MKLTQNQFYGLEREVPGVLKPGSTFFAIDSNKMYTYGESGIPVKANESESLSVETITSDSTISEGSFVLVDATNGEVSITLPKASLGSNVSIKKIDATINKIVISPSLIAEKVEFSDNLELLVQGESVDLYSNGSDWFVK